MAVDDGRFVSSAEFFSGLGGEDSVYSIEDDDETLTIALKRAEETAISYLTRRYFLPETPEESESSPGLKDIVLKLAKFEIKEVSANQVPSDTEIAIYEKNISFLNEVRKGKPESPTIVGLVERNQKAEMSVSTPELDPLTQPKQAGRLTGMRPSSDLSGRRYNRNSMEWLGWEPYR